MPIIPALGRQSPVDLFELEVSLVHIANFRPPELFTETLSQKRKIYIATYLCYLVVKIPDTDTMNCCVGQQEL